MSTDICEHCGYRIPGQASICSGCGRRRGMRAPRIEELPLHRSPLLRDARWARRFLVVSGWLGVGLGLAAAARAIVGIDRVAEDLAVDAQLQIDHFGRLVALSTLLALGCTALALLAWGRCTYRNTRALRLHAGATSPWSLPGWLLPGRAARAAKTSVDQVWREHSPLVGALPRRGSSRRLVSRVVLRWWSLWLWVPATGVLVAVVAHADDGALRDERGLVAVAAGALLVATARAFYDVVGIITMAHAHQTGNTVHARHRSEEPWDNGPDWDDADDEAQGPLEPLAW